MKGRRLSDGDHPPSIVKPGDYWKSSMGWVGITPNGLLGNFRAHTVVEHDDDTITVSPSILVTQSNVGTWHGYLERGVWRAC